MNIRRTLCFLASIALYGCGGGGSSSSPTTVAPAPAASPPVVPAAAAPASVEREITPQSANPALTTFLSPHFTLNPDTGVTAKGRLFVMLPGTDAIPRFYRDIVRTGAMRGYHGIGLMYPNDVAVGDRCAGNPDPDCAGKVRREVITGEDTSALITIDRSNSVAGRLASLLAYLHATYPTEGWGQFLTGGQVDWPKVTAAGHSQGGGHAAYLAKLFLLDRTVMFSSPSDVGAAPGSSALWFSQTNVTPLSRQYGFTHTADELVPYTFVTFNWRAIGIDAFGSMQSVDTTTAPYANSHQLDTAAAPNPSPPAPVPSPRHSSPVVDAVTPRTATGDAVYRPVWIYLAFP